MTRYGLSLLGAAALVVATGGTALSAPQLVMSAPPGTRLDAPRLAVFAGGDAAVLVRQGTEIQYATRRPTGWSAPNALPRLFGPISEVSAVQRGQRWLLSWVGKPGAPGSRRLVFVEFRGARTVPTQGRSFTRNLVGDPIAYPGLGNNNARAVWPVVADANRGIFEGATVPGGRWAPANFLPDLEFLGLATTPRADRLLVVRALEGGVESVRWSQVGAGEKFQTPSVLYTPPPNRVTLRAAPVFRATGGAGVVLLTNADPLQLRLEAVSINGQTVGAPQTISTERVDVTSAPRVASLADGRLVAVWKRVTPPRVELVAAAEQTVGGTWTAPVVLSGPGRPGDPVLAVSPAGQPVVAWSQGGHVQARGLRVAQTVTPRTMTRISGRLPHCRTPAITLQGNRTITAAFPCYAGRRLYVTSTPLP